MRQLSTKQLDHLHKLIMVSKDRLDHFKEINLLIVDMKLRARKFGEKNSKKCKEYYKNNKEKVLEKKKEFYKKNSTELKFKRNGIEIVK